MGVDVEKNDAETEDIAGIRTGKDPRTHFDVMESKVLENTIDNLGLLWDQEGCEELTKRRFHPHLLKIKQLDEFFQQFKMKLVILSQVSPNDILADTRPLSKRPFFFFRFVSLSVPFPSVPRKKEKNRRIKPCDCLGRKIG